MTQPTDIEGLLREVAPQALGAVVRQSGDFAAAEDAVQEALLAAALHWPKEGVPGNPRGWLIQAAMRRVTDQARSDHARRRREEAVTTSHQATEPPPVTGEDDTLMLLFMCCHPALTPASSIALTLRAVGGLTTAEIAQAFLVPEATMAQRISRAKQRIKASGEPFRSPPTEAISRGSIGEYQLQAAIAALHDQATYADHTDWPQILALYGLLERMSGNPVVVLNRAIAAAMVHGPAVGLELLAPLDEPLAGHYRLAAVRAHLLEMLGDTDAAAAHYRLAADRTPNLPERHYLTLKVARLRA